MSDLTTLQTRLRTLLQDPDGLFWTAPELESALRLSLDVYSEANPRQDIAVLSLTKAGREISLESLPGLRGVTEVWWPFDSLNADLEWPPNRVRGFRLARQLGKNVLFLNTRFGKLPGLGEEVRLWYTLNHTISGLDGAAQTTLSPEAENLIVTGAAGMAASLKAVDPSLTLPWEQVAHCAGSWLTTFEAGIERLRRQTARSVGEPWSAGWRMDAWDTGSDPG